MRKITELIKLEQIPSGTAQQRKVAYMHGRVMSYPSKSLSKTRSVYAMALRGARKPSEPFTGAVKLSLSFLYATKDKRKQRAYWKTTRPDCDNLAKVFIDELVHEGWLVDDSIISSLTITKRWHTEAMILLEIEEVDVEQ